jgi:parallel beta-helix repeat protein
MRDKLLVLAAVLGILACPTWAVRPENPPGHILYLSDEDMPVAPGASHIQPAAGAPHGTKAATQKVSARIRAHRRFLESAGRDWSVTWNTATNTPHHVTGYPYVLGDGQKLTERNVELICQDFVNSNADFLGTDSADLQLSNKVRAGGRWFVRFRQVYNGLTVLAGQLKMSFTPDDRLFTFASDVYPDVAVDTDPNVEGAEALSVALSDCGWISENDTVTGPELTIVPLRRPQDFAYRLCWRLYVLQPAIHKKWQYIIDAHTGRIIGKSNVLVYQSVNGTGQLEYTPEFADDPVQIDPFSYGDIAAYGPKVAIASWNLDTDPGWATEGDWAFGIPMGSDSILCDDPNSGHTGTYVYGYNLDGRYEDNMQAYHLTTTAIDCSDFDNVRLQFMRWLSVDSSESDNASIEVSNDGLTWSTVWTNPQTWLCDEGWVLASHDISAVAAGQSSVYIRWVMGPTNDIIAFGGWNIDDVELISYLGGFTCARTNLDGSYTVSAPWQNFTLVSELEGAYCDVRYGCGPDAFLEKPQVQAGNTADFTWDGNSYTELAESNAYRHINHVHDYYTYMDPNLRDSSDSFPSGLDYPMQVTVQLGCDVGFCNAYWDGRAITLGAGDGVRCDDFALYSEVIYHEYSHAVTSKIYDGVPLPYAMEPGALNESWSDYFACVLSPSQSPLVGEGGLVFESPEGFRTLDNSFRRDTDFFDEVHVDSQMVSSALWQIREAMDRNGQAEHWDRTVHFARYEHPKTFDEFLLALLTEDDAHYGDAYLANGTPHAKQIYAAFGDHAIGGLQYLPESIVIADSNGNMDSRLDPGETVQLSLSLTNGWADATRISARLFSHDSFVKIKNPTADFNDVRHGGVTDNGVDPFLVSLDADCPPTHTINFELQITADGPYAYSRTCLLTYAVAVGQLAYDDGQVDDAYLGYGKSGGALVVRMTPEYYPSYLTHVRLFPPPDSESNLTVKFWDDDGPNSLPGTVLGTIDVDVNGTGCWLDVSVASLDLRIDTGSFYVGWVEGETKYSNGLDKDPPYYYRSYAYVTSLKEWMALSDLGYLSNLMLRVRYVHDLNECPVENSTTGRRYATIQSAIDEAYPGDEIIVGEGIYHENIDFLGKAVTVRSSEPTNEQVVGATIIMGTGAGPAVKFSSAEGRDSVVRGFTITGNSRGGNNSAGVSCVRLRRSGPTIANCVITSNCGAGVRCVTAGPIIANCLVSSNQGDGIKLRAKSYPDISNCLIVDNTRHGVFGAYPEIRNCTISGNMGSGVFNRRATITNSIIQHNGGTAIKGRARVRYSNIEGLWPGLGNIDADPCFVNPTGGDYHLKSAGWRWERTQKKWTWDDVTSRCIDAGNPGSDPVLEPVILDVDPLGRFAVNQRLNMGYYGGTGEASMPPYDWALLGDLTNDGIVGLEDLRGLAANWLDSENERSGDVNRDGVVNMVDFALLVSDWQRTTSWH